GGGAGERAARRLRPLRDARALRDVRGGDLVRPHQTDLLRRRRSQGRRGRERRALFLLPDLPAPARGLWRHRGKRGRGAAAQFFPASALKLAAGDAHCIAPSAVIAGHSASKTRVNALMTRQSILELKRFFSMDANVTRACPSYVCLSAASRVNPTCGVKPGHDESNTTVAGNAESRRLS